MIPWRDWIAQKDDDDGKVPDLSESLAIKRHFAAELEAHSERQASKQAAEDAARKWIKR